VVVFTGKLSTLRRFKEDASEVSHGYECGITIEGYNDLKEGDSIEAFEIETTAATLDAAITDTKTGRR
jgi:translation initiation factor IF-2